ncbi:AAA+ ATPase domain and ATPase, AAA-type, core domain and P-loop containing nucleoside triphosphate hydrolase domain-containing protein [Strongyloides ratti]|uniref:AAA+ ATPase domain and ATPase, AAA-type, core domain and P-loop containing nucleoside triphosphate hydrolase domain-containing protein n=1 Tax=Strongyloides ratti TaxID=34506 RepID=A0A090N0I9_STRRB|nr:AAA+ ATPase domain and ATPase, AAA-type, core domain and P-loop containing nucleoside triphosphate hydrolase domain-containing protein [Strongyloides ratti]CEF70768.2 AAA+ ATPase domain and ATPase, AAA-type, core domain and P-loop containing nucleoside triphosphate hydrolase domain-containing protein [Strongyloides ratti]
MSISLDNIYEIYEKGCKHNDHGNLKMASVFIKEAIKACESLIDNSKNSKDRNNAVQALKVMKDHEKSIDELERKIDDIGKLIRCQSSLEPTPSDPLPQQKNTKITPIQGKGIKSRINARGGTNLSSSTTGSSPSSKKNTPTGGKGTNKTPVSRETKAKAASNVASSYDAVNKFDDGNSNSKDDNDDQNEPSEFVSLQSPELVECVKTSIKDENPNVQWDDIVGLDQLKTSLRHSIVVSKILPQLFVGIRRPTRTFLLYGPPGTGKTLIAKAVATECQYKFFCVTPSVISSKWRGDSEKLIRVLFDTAKSYSPSILFFDEIDSITLRRGKNAEHEATRRTICEFLVQFEEISKSEETKVYVLAATNRPWDIDEAVLRRFEAKFYVPLPDEASRSVIVKNAMREIHLSDEFSFDNVAKKLEGYSASDIVNICKTAAMIPVSEFLKSISISDMASLQDEG